MFGFRQDMDRFCRFFQAVKLSLYRENGSTEKSFYFSISPIRMVQENDDLPSVGLSAKLAKLLRLVTSHLKFSGPWEIISAHCTLS